MIGVILGGLLYAILSGEPLNDNGLYWVVWLISLPIFGGLWGISAICLEEE